VANFADSNRAGIKLIQENNLTWGVTPTTGKTRNIRITSSSLVAEKETVVSDELRSDRMVSSVVEVSAQTTGDINYEFSAGSHDILMQAFLLGLWTRPMEFDYFKGNVAWGTTSRIDLSGGDYRDYFTVGRRIKTTGFTNPSNNKYNEIASMAFTGGVTQITVTTTNAVVEAASAFTKVQDANDVIILNSTAIRFGTTGASTIDSNGTNAFAAAITAGNLVAGQNIYVDNGSGRETGSYSFATNASDNDTFTISDGINSVIFELDAGTGVIPGNQSVALGGTGTLTATNLAAAINTARVDGRLQVKAVAATTTVTITNLRRGGGSLTKVSVNGTVTNFTGGIAGSGGFFKIVAVADDVLTVSPAPTTDANAGAAAVTIKGSMLRNPDGTGTLPHQQIVAQSFTAETGFADVNQYFTHNGLRVGSFSMDVSTGAIVTGTYAFEGKETKRLLTGTTFLGATPFTPLKTTATEVMNSTTNVGLIEKDGVELSSALQSIALEGDATLRQQPAVGSKFARGIGTGRFNLTGTVTAYFENGALYDDFITHDTASLAFRFTDIDGNTYKYTLPAVKFTSDAIAPSGIDQDVVEPLEFTAFRDGTTGTMFQIDRWSDIKNVSA